MSPALLILIPFLTAILILLLRRLPVALPLALPALIACLVGIGFDLAPVLRAEAVRSQLEPLAGLRLSFRLDGLNLLFLLPMVTAALAACLQARLLLVQNRHRIRFDTLTLLTLSALVAALLAEGIFLAALAWALAALFGAALLAASGERPAGPGLAWPVCLLALLAGALLFSGIHLLSGPAGKDEITLIAHRGREIAAAGGSLTGSALIMGGAAAGAGLVPFALRWSRPLYAPAPAAAFLLPAGLALVATCLLIRLAPAIGDTALRHWGLTGIGLISLLVGAGAALRRNGLAGIAAGLGMAEFGLIFAMTGIGGAEALAAALLLVLPLVAALLSLLLCAGLIRRETGNGHLSQPGGLFARMPLTTGIAIIALLSLAGIMPLAGFHPLLASLQAATLQADPLARGLIFTGAAAGYVLIIAAVLRCLRLALGTEAEPDAPLSEGRLAWLRDPRPGLLAVPAAVALLLLPLGIWPDLALQPLAQAALRAASPSEAGAQLSITLWPGPETGAPWLWLALTGAGLILSGLLCRRSPDRSRAKPGDPRRG